MKEIQINRLSEGQTLIKTLNKILPLAGNTFLYKMMRKKNITLNDRKVTGKERLVAGDSVKIWFSDETYLKFSGEGAKSAEDLSKVPVSGSFKTDAENARHIDGTRIPSVVYEDEDILVFNKPTGMLSQKAVPTDYSIVEALSDYLLLTKKRTPDDFKLYKPGTANRLDRNTSGLIACGLTERGAQYLSEVIRERSAGKYYIALVSGRLETRRLLKGWLYKNEDTNEVQIITEASHPLVQSLEAKAIETEYIPVAINGRVIGNEQVTLLKIHLITGRSHQIRAHLSSVGHPILGDYKYGIRVVNERAKKLYRVKSQMLHAEQMILPERKDSDRTFEERRITAPIPDEFIAVLKGENLWEPGIPEALEDLH